MINNSWTQTKTIPNKDSNILVEQQTQAAICSEMLTNLIKTGRVSIGDRIKTDGKIIYIDNNMTVTVNLSIGE